MSKDISIRVSAKMYDVLKDRAAVNKISVRELASVFFHYGFQTSVEALKEAQIKANIIAPEEKKEEQSNEN